MKRMLINATQQEEMRVALVDGQHLYDLDIENVATKQKKANIYKGKITRIEPSLEACFVDYGSERHGFLPFKEIAREYYKNPSDHSLSVKDQLDEGTELIVQVEREERGNKGAALTTYVSLAGRYLVLMPNNPKAGGVSRRISGKQRAEIRDAMAALVIPEEMGIIVRTAGMGRTAEELQWDLDYLIMLWEAILDAGKKPAPLLIFQESNIIIRALRDYYRSDIGEILIDDEEVFKEAEVFINNIMPQIGDKIKLYEDQVPLFTRFQVESQIQTAYERNVRLPSGGALVFDHTEALVSIDINSGRSTKGADIEDTALNTNLEAAEEIARQLKLRDLGGLVVIDFIDMLESKNQRKVENALHDALASDRARIQVGQISRFGLLEMSRQRLRPSLDETSHIVCPRCEGQGTIRDTKSLALGILRLIEEESLKEKTSELVIQVPVNVAVYLLNEKRADVEDIEDRLNVRVIIIPDTHLDTPHFKITRYRVSDEVVGEDSEAHLIKEEVTLEDMRSEAVIQSKQVMEKPAVSGISPIAPPPKVEVEEKKADILTKSQSLLSSILNYIKGFFAKDEEKQDERKESGKKARDHKNQRNNKNNGNRARNNNNRQRNQRHNHPSRNTIETIEREVDLGAEFNQNVNAEDSARESNNRGQQSNRRNGQNDRNNDRNNERNDRNNDRRRNEQNGSGNDQSRRQSKQENGDQANHQQDQKSQARNNEGKGRNDRNEGKDQDRKSRNQSVTPDHDAKENTAKDNDAKKRDSAENNAQEKGAKQENRASSQNRSRRNNKQNRPEKRDPDSVINEKGEEIIQVTVGDKVEERIIRQGRPRIAKAEAKEIVNEPVSNEKETVEPTHSVISDDAMDIITKPEKTVAATVAVIALENDSVQKMTISKGRNRRAAKVIEAEALESTDAIDASSDAHTTEHSMTTPVAANVDTVVVESTTSAATQEAVSVVTETKQDVSTSPVESSVMTSDSLSSAPEVIELADNKTEAIVTNDLQDVALESASVETAPAEDTVTSSESTHIADTNHSEEVTAAVDTLEASDVAETIVESDGAQNVVEMPKEAEVLISGDSEKEVETVVTAEATSEDSIAQEALVTEVAISENAQESTNQGKSNDIDAPKAVEAIKEEAAKEEEAKEEIKEEVQDKRPSNNRGRKGGRTIKPGKPTRSKAKNRTKVIVSDDVLPNKKGNAEPKAVVEVGKSESTNQASTDSDKASS
ncbi:ribonuclease E/G [Ignatzschineria ureiclastica]|uniref:Ribonuclease E n=2 Tax=Ignatzschineria ureiclastica TaxID=472582 RepID=A0A2U2AF96_9GAMM|nr:Rne/Rng family ribonuclease [Ignatzschineria ureiclastica]PWD81325.1 ribonuclease E/G [Ignatzschineria ureiclastica]GGZ98057.1 ribonuclease E [Ignatzschineria ureiclastica]